MKISHVPSLALILMFVSLGQAGESEETRRKAIQQKLDSEETQIEFIETPLQDVAAYLGDLHDLTIVLDRPALDDAGIGTDAPVTSNLSLVGLRSALRLVLGELDMQYVVRDGYLLLTTRQVADQMREQRVYPVSDLIGRKTESGALLQDAEPLLELVEALSPQGQVGRLRPHVRRGVACHAADSSTRAVGRHLGRFAKISRAESQCTLRGKSTMDIARSRQP